MTDSQLLAEFARTRSSEAFAEIVRRHVDLVYGTARRLVEDEPLAQDVAQAAFIVLAKKARHVEGRRLPGWLVNTTRLAAKDARRAKLCREKHEGRAAQMRSSMAPSADEPTLEELTPLLDEALARLNEMDRTAVVTRFLQGKSFAEVGAAMGSSEEAARKRVERAVEKLRAILMKRGVVPSVGGLMVILAANQAQAAPAGLAGMISAGAVSGGVGTSAILAKGVMEMMAWGQARAVAIVAVVAMAVGTGVSMAQRSTSPEVAAGATATQPAVVRMATATTVPGVPVAAELVRQVRAGEAWIYDARSLDVEFTATWTKQGAPQVATDRFRVMFDRQHAQYLREKEAGEPPSYELRVWDGPRCTMLDRTADGKGYSCSIVQGRNVWVVKPWAIEGRAFWFETQGPLPKDDPYGMPEEYEVVGRKVFHDVDCQVVQRTWDGRAQRFYIGTADGRAYGVGLYLLGDDMDAPEVIDAIREEAAAQGQIISNTQGAHQWLAKQPMPIWSKLYRRMWQSLTAQSERWYSDYQQLGPGRWAPTKSGYKTGDVSCEMKVTRLAANEPLEANVFQIQIPDGTPVVDYTHKPSLQYVYKANRATTEPK